LRCARAQHHQRIRHARRVPVTLPPTCARAGSCCTVKVTAPLAAAGKTPALPLRSTMSVCPSGSPWRDRRRGPRRGGCVTEPSTENRERVAGAERPSFSRSTHATSHPHGAIGAVRPQSLRSGVRHQAPTRAARESLASAWRRRLPPALVNSGIRATGTESRPFAGAPTWIAIGSSTNFPQAASAHADAAAKQCAAPEDRCPCAKPTGRERPRRLSRRGSRGRGLRR